MNTQFHTRKYSGLQINGNQITGNTFVAKDWIKAYLSGKWNKETGSWIIDTEKFDKFVISGVIYIDSNTAQETTASKHNHNGICPRCHTYCDGDCAAN